MKNKLLLKKLTHVENSFVGKLFRTLGFLAILVIALLIGNKYLFWFGDSLNINAVVDLSDKLKDFTDDNLAFLNDYLLLMFFGGLLFLIWPLSKKKALPTLLTILGLVLVFVNDSTKILMPFIPFYEVPSISFLDNLIGDNNWILLALQLFIILLVYLVFATKKPKRFSTTVVGAGMLLLLFAVALTSLPALLNNSWDSKTAFIAIESGVHTLAYLLMVIGSLFGFLGFARK